VRRAGRRWQPGWPGTGGRGERPAGRGCAGGDAGTFAASRERFGTVVAFLDGTRAAGLSHSELEDYLDKDGRALLRQLLADHLLVRELREEKVDVADDAGVRRGRVETGHARVLATVFGEVRVGRLAYRAPGQANLHPADGLLNLPTGKHSHGLRRLAAIES
jgi:hypothetical protein